MGRGRADGGERAVPGTLRGWHRTWVSLRARGEATGAWGADRWHHYVYISKGTLWQEGRGRQRRAIWWAHLSYNGDLRDMTLGRDLKDDWAWDTPTATSVVMGWWLMPGVEGRGEESGVVPRFLFAKLGKRGLHLLWQLGRGSRSRQGCRKSRVLLWAHEAEVSVAMQEKMPECQSDKRIWACIRGSRPY